MPWHRAFGRRMPGHRASRCSSRWHLLTGQSVSGHFPSGRSHVRAFSFWMQPCQGIFLLGAAVSGQMASRRRVLWHHGHAFCQGTEHRSKYSCRIRKHAVGSRYSDSVQFYSFYLIYIYICYYRTSRVSYPSSAGMTVKDSSKDSWIKMAEYWASGDDGPETASVDDGPEATCPQMTAALVSEHRFRRQSSILSPWRVPQARCI